MTSYSLSSILLPAVFVSSAVFSTLTIPFALIKTEPVAVELPPLFSGEIQPIFNGEHKDVAIPYIGFAIVASVGAGIATVEVNRRWQAYRESLLIQSAATQSENTEDTETIDLAEYRPEASAIDLPIKEDFVWNQEPNIALSVTDSSTTEATKNVVDITQLGKTYQTLSNSTIFENLNFSSAEAENSSELLEGNGQISAVAAQKINLNLSKILNSHQEYQTCRIKVPHSKQSLLAIFFDGEYYSFLRAEKTKEKVLEMLDKINHQVEKTVITNTAKGYVIWNFEPEVSEKI
jgi:hypothetical protein